MNSNTVKTSIHLAISADSCTRTETVLKATYLDLDLVLMQLERLAAQNGDAWCSLDSLSFGEGLFKFNLRSSLYIRSLNELIAFVKNLASYIEHGVESKTVDQLIAEYAGCFDEYYHDLKPSEILDAVKSKVVASKPCGQVTRDDRANKVVQYNNGISVIFNEAA